jgi:hypothetical protein
MKALRRPIDHTQKEVIWLHLRGEGDRDWRKVRFTGVKTLLRFLETKEWGFVGLLIVFERRSVARVRFR